MQGYGAAPPPPPPPPGGRPYLPPGPPPPPGYGRGRQLFHPPPCAPYSLTARHRLARRPATAGAVGARRRGLLLQAQDGPGLGGCRVDGRRHATTTAGVTATAHGVPRRPPGAADVARADGPPAAAPVRGVRPPAAPAAGARGVPQPAPPRLRGARERR
jgi:hypothetical protein